MRTTLDTRTSDASRCAHSTSNISVEGGALSFSAAATVKEELANAAEGGSRGGEGPPWRRWRLRSWRRRRGDDDGGAAQQLFTLQMLRFSPSERTAEPRARWSRPRAWRRTSRLHRSGSARRTAENAAFETPFGRSDSVRTM